MLTPLQRIDTRDAAGKPNGWVVPIWRADSGERIEQVYLTVVNPGTTKGPHLHKVRTGRFTCIRGKVEIVTKQESDGGLPFEGQWWQDGYCVTILSGDEPKTVVISPGVPALIRCAGKEPAYLLNMPDPAWSAADPDEHEVTDWNPPC